VSTASGICHTVTAICRYRGRVGNRSECAVGGVRNNTQHPQEKSTPPAGFEPAIPTYALSKPHALDGTATGIGTFTQSPKLLAGT
jgi:hypothetical protein